MIVMNGTQRASPIANALGVRGELNGSDAIVQQVTVLIVQLATSGGVRAPVAHIANQVFIQLALELQSQASAAR